MRCGSASPVSDLICPGRLVRTAFQDVTPPFTQADPPRTLGQVHASTMGWWKCSDHLQRSSLPFAPWALPVQPMSHQRLRGPTGTPVVLQLAGLRSRRISVGQLEAHLSTNQGGYSITCSDEGADPPPRTYNPDTSRQLSGASCGFSSLSWRPLLVCYLPSPPAPSR